MAKAQTYDYLVFEQNGLYYYINDDGNAQIIEGALVPITLNIMVICLVGIMMQSMTSCQAIEVMLRCPLK